MYENSNLSHIAPLVIFLILFLLWLGYKGLQALRTRIETIKKKSPLTRALFGLGAFWVVVRPIYVFLFSPYGDHFYPSDWVHFWGSLLFPLFAMWFGFMIWQWVGWNDHEPQEVAEKTSLEKNVK